MKHEIRREFHPQLRRLWETNRNLLEFPEAVLWSDETKPFIASPDDPSWQKKASEQIKHIREHYDKLSKEERRKDGLELIKRNWERFGYKFIPLVTEEMCVRCSLDILFLRPEEPGLLIHSGDIDARLKTIFDALRLPKNLAETGEMGPQQGEEPFYCLLEDDKLISEIRVTADQLLLLPREKTLEANDALLVINVKLKTTKKHPYDWVFA